jgi:hypothetical protein
LESLAQLGAGLLLLLLLLLPPMLHSCGRSTSISTLACSAPTVLGFFSSTQIFCRVSNGFRGSFVRDGEPFARHFCCGGPRVSGQVLDFPLQLLLHYFLPFLLCSSFLFLDFLESMMLMMMMMMMTTVKLMVPLCTVVHITL